MQPNNILAKSNGSITLKQHSVNVLNVMKTLIDRIGIRNIGMIGFENFKVYLYLIALLHDIGKCYSKFQNYIKNGIIDENVDDDNDAIRHNVIAWGFLRRFKIFIDDPEHKSLNNSRVSTISSYLLCNTILYHHRFFDEYSIEDVLDAIGYDENGFLSEDEQMMIDHLEWAIDYIKNEFGNTVEFLYCGYDNIEEKVPHFVFEPKKDISKRRSNIENVFCPDSVLMSAKNLLISADRIASMLENQNTVQVLTDDMIGSYIDSMNTKCYDINTYNPVNNSKIDIDRFNMQKQSAIEMSKHHTSILTLGAGGGKTFISLMWHMALNNGKKLVFVLPNNELSKELYDSVTRTIAEFGLPNWSVGLLLTNVYIHGSKDSDIIVTNIDNWNRPVIRTDKEIYGFEMLDVNIVFDEHHLLVSGDMNFALVSMFVSFRNKYCENANTLVMSATPNMFLKELISSEKYPVYQCRMPSHLDNQRYKIHFDEVPKIDENSNALIILNSIKNSQKAFCGYSCENDRLFHSAFTESDKESNFNYIKKYHGKDSLNNPDKRNLFATRIANTGKDISFSILVDSICSFEEFLQALGRVGRWGEYKDRVIDVYVNNYTSNPGEMSAISVRNDAKDKGEVGAVDIARKSYSFLKQHTENLEYITNKELYDLFDLFNEEYSDDIDKYYSNMLYHSMNSLYGYFYKTEKVDGSDSKSSSPLRDGGQSIYILPLENNSNTEFHTEAITMDYALVKECVDVMEIKDFYTVYEWMKEHGIAEKYFKKEPDLKNVDKSEKRMHGLKMKYLYMGLNKNTPIPLIWRRYNSLYGLYERKETKFNI